MYLASDSRLTREQTNKNAEIIGASVASGSDAWSSLRASDVPSLVSHARVMGKFLASGTVAWHLHSTHQWDTAPQLLMYEIHHYDIHERCQALSLYRPSHLQQPVVSKTSTERQYNDILLQYFKIYSNLVYKLSTADKYLIYFILLQK